MSGVYIVDTVMLITPVRTFACGAEYPIRQAHIHQKVWNPGRTNKKTAKEPRLIASRSSGGFDGTKRFLPQPPLPPALITPPPWGTPRVPRPPFTNAFEKPRNWGDGASLTTCSVPCFELLFGVSPSVPAKIHKSKTTRYERINVALNDATQRMYARLT